MPPSADSLRTSSTAARRIITPLGSSPTPMALQRSEFEDFMNAYRPTSDVVRKEEEPPKAPAVEDSKVDLGKSLKRLMKRTPTSPSVSTKSQKKETSSQRIPTDRDKTVSNELKPPSTSYVKKASKPSATHGDIGSGSVQPQTFQQRSTHPSGGPDNKGLSTTKGEVSPLKNGSKTKSDRVASQDQQKPPLDAVMQPATVMRPPSPVPVILPKVPVQESRKDVPLPSSSQPSSPTERDTHCLLAARSVLDRFLPPRKNNDPLLNLRVVEAPERKYRIIMEFEESISFQRPKSSPSGLYFVNQDDDDHQRNVWDQLEAFNWTRQSKIASAGMLLANVERISDFPFVTHLVITGGKNEFHQKVNQIRNRILPAENTQLHFVAGYEEAVTVCRPPLPVVPEKPSSNRCGYVISLYQVLPGDDRERFEQNWTMWTGARQLYSHAPEHMGLKRISIYKSVVPTEIIIYVLLCEFSCIMDHLTEACVLVDQLRARCCGFTGIYRVLDIL